MSTPTHSLGAVVAEALDAAGISQNAAALITGISRQTLRRRLSHGNFTTAELYATSALLHMLPSELMARAEERAA